jgi:alpha-methylacyl-CoA racemase
MTDPYAQGPLAGLKVIELAGIGPGPFAAMTLADLGADVIRVDRPGGSGPGAPAINLINRGKRSVILDLKRPPAIDALLTLVASADVLIEGYRPGVTERLGVGPDACWARNPRLVYGRMTGWGQSGPLAHAAGHDIDYISLTGALHAIGEAGGPPQIPINLLGDFGGGSTYLVIGILAALREADRTGRGQVVDAAIVDGAAHLLTAVHALLAGGRWTDERGVNLLDGGAPYYSVYATADGRHMSVGAIEPKFYAELLRLLDLDEDPALQNDREHWPALRKRLAATFAARPMAEWTRLFDGTDACVAPVLSLREAPTHPHISDRGTLAEVDGVLQPAPAPRFSGARPAAAPRAPSPPPTPGEHTLEVLTAAGVADPGRLVADGAAIQA